MRPQRIWQHLIWPPRSLVGGENPISGSAIAPDDFAKLTFLSGAGCRRCAVPTEIDLGEASLCGACAAKQPLWDQARAALAYDDISKRAILDLKHAGRRDGLDVIGNWMAIAGDDILQSSDALIPVPLHYRRLASDLAKHFETQEGDAQPRRVNLKTTGEKCVWRVSSPNTRPKKAIGTDPHLDR